MKVTPFDRNTFLVESRSRPDEHHITDIEEMTCSCEGFQFNKTCQHLKAVMSTETTDELQLAPEQPGEAPMKQLAPYDEFKTKIESLKKTAETITVTDIAQTAEMKIARTTRLAIKDIRIAITHRHKELKENILVEGRKIDAGKNELLAVLEPLELRLKDQEEFIEKETARIQAEKRIARTAEISPFLQSAPLVDLGVVKDDAYAYMLQDAKDAHSARLAREQKERDETAAKIKAEAEERERIRMENERLKQEAIEAEKKAKAEREEAEKARKEAEEKARVEREEAAATLKAAQAKAEQDAKAEREAYRKREEQLAAAAKREREIAEAAAKKQREEIEAKARAERETAEAEAKKELEAAAKENARLAKIAEEQRQKAATAAREAREAKEAQEKQAAAQRAKEEAERKRIADEAAALAKSPDKEKLLAFAETIWALKLPALTTDEGNTVMQSLEANIKKLGTWIETKANEL